MKDTSSDQEQNIDSSQSQNNSISSEESINNDTKVMQTNELVIPEPERKAIPFKKRMQIKSVEVSFTQNGHVTKLRYKFDCLETFHALSMLVWRPANSNFVFLGPSCNIKLPPLFFYYKYDIKITDIEWRKFDDPIDSDEITEE